MRSVAFILCVLLPFSAFALKPVISFERYSTAHGLSHNTVYATLKDAQGFIWVATKDGLNRFDGHEFRTFKAHPDRPDSLSNNVIRTLKLDSRQRLWIGTENGLNRYDPKTESFIRYFHQPGNNNSLDDNAIRAIEIDHQNELWIGTEKGLNRFDSANNRFVRFSPDADGPANIRQIAFDGQGRMWVASFSRGLARLEQNKFQYFGDPQGVDSKAGFSLVIDDRQQVWFGSRNGLFVLKAGSHEFVKITQGINHKSILSLSLGPMGNLWVGSFNGVNVLNPQNMVTIDPGLKPPKSDKKFEFVWSIYHDGLGSIWLGTFHGLVKVRDANALFGHFQVKVADRQGSASVRAIMQDSKGALWIGTDGDGLKRQNQFSGTLDNIDGLPSSVVFALLQGQSGNIYVGTAAGLVTIDGRTGTVSSVPGLTRNIISSLFEDSKGRLWIGTYRDGLKRLQHNRITEFKKRENPGSVSHNVIRGITEDQKGQIWIGTVGGGLNRYDESSQTFEHFVHDPEDANSLAGNMVNDLLVDLQGTLWVGLLGGGLDRFDEQSGSFVHLTEADGLSNDTVASILQDSQGALWLSTNKGLNRYWAESGEIVHYDLPDGLQDDQFNPGARFSAPDGALFFAGINGFNRFQPVKLRAEKTAARIQLTDFLLFNESMPVGAEHQDFVLGEAIGGLSKLTLSHKQNFIGIGFSALEFNNPQKLRYAYQLVGWDKDWIEADNNLRRASYTNLPPGEYQFKVKARLKHGNWLQSEKQLKIHYLTPWWLSWWAVMLYTAVFVTLVGLFISVRIERKKRLMEHKVIAQLQHLNQLKDEFLANTSHELRTPLNGIIGLAESLLDGVAGPLPDKANKNLSMVVSSGRRLANLVNDILDFSKLSKRKVVLHTKPVNLHQTCELIFNLSAPLLQGKALTLVNEVAPDLCAVMADEDRLQQILHNLIGNAIKFSEQGDIKISAQQSGDFIHVSVTDQGIGISPSQFDNIFAQFEQVEGGTGRQYSGTGLGLAVSKQLVELHGGKIWVESALGQGATFTFSLPLTLEAAVEPTSSIEQCVARLNVLPEPRESESNEQTLEALEGEFRILIVDDEPVNRQVLQDHLAGHRYQIVEAKGGEQAIELLESDEHFDLVLLDIMMPKVSGYEVCAKLREIYPVNDLPVIFLTAKNQVVDLVESFAVGANDYLSKPVAKHELLSRVNTHLKLLDINRHLETKVAQRTEELVQATEAKSDFLAKMSHEIRTPMNAVIGLSRLTLKTQLNEQQKDYIEKVVDAGEALLGLINDILDFSKIEAGKLTIESTVFRLDKLVQRSVNLSAMNAHVKGLELITDIDSGIPAQLIGDPLRIQQIVVNLVNNAVKFTEVGAVCIRMRLHSQTGDEVVLHGVVQDTGIGMTKQQQSRLFQSFSQADESISRKHGGTGLGLAISRQLCELMGGEIWLTSEPGVGSEFHFTVKVASAPAEPIEDQQQTDILKDIKALVVDDISMASQVLVKILQELGVACEALDDVHHALIKVRKEPVDLVLLDFSEQSISAAKKFKQDVIFLASTYEKENVPGMVLEKPFNHSSVFKALASWRSGGKISGSQERAQLAVPSLSGYRILLVDDNAINRQVAAGFLSDTQVDFDVAENGLVALAYLKQENYDLVLMDIEMPHMDGISATKEIRFTLGLTNLPVIAMTAHVLPTEIAKARQAGMNAHLTKPLDPQTLYQCLSEYLPYKASDDTATVTLQTRQSTMAEHKIIESLQQIDKLEVNKALANLHGKRTLYLGMVKDFGNLTELPHHLLRLFEQQQYQEVYRHIHSLKSNAAYIGAFALSNQCAELEEQMAKQQYDRNQFSKVLAQLSDILNLLYPLLPQHKALSIDFSIDRLKQSLSRLIPLLKSSDLAAEELIPELLAMCRDSDYQQAIEEIAELVDDIEYEQAFVAAVKLQDAITN